MKKNNLMPTVVLSAICVLTVAVLAFVNLVTGPQIKANQDKKAQEALLEVMPDGVSFKNIGIEGLPSEITNAYKSESGGYVFQMEVNGYKSGLIIMCGISADGRITGAKYIQSSETLGAENELGGKYVGKDSMDYETVEVISGATLTSKGYRQAIAAALNAFDKLEGGK